MINSKDFNFSFSGLKTAVLYKMKELQKNKKLQEALAYEFQQAAIDVLVSKTIKAAEKYNPKTIMLAGGVSANQELRKQLGEFIEKNIPSARYILPALSYSTDNAAMVAAAGYFRWREMPAARRKEALRNWQTLQADANLELA